MAEQTTKGTGACSHNTHYQVDEKCCVFQVGNIDGKGKLAIPTVENIDKKALRC